MIYIAGGRIDNGLLATSMERYSITRKTWTILKPKMPYSVDMHGLILLPGPGTRLLLFAGLDLN